ncbi:M20/M25/M40 family metallo-hydrolase [Nitratireductor alexandrii]|uniref:M20/M25/M40 family metallo-hydrolase n=1 Tax=Nitratireductor alexandrii TaxID=2448161 RepID=UPI003B8483B7
MSTNMPSPIRTDIGVSAVMTAGRLIARLAEMAEAQKRPGLLQQAFVPPYTTIHVGMVQGGLAPSIIARHCAFCWDIRTLPGTKSQKIVDTFTHWVEDVILPEMRAVGPRSSIRTTTDFDIPPLAVDTNSSAERLVRALTGDREVRCVGYATEAGLFQGQGIDTVLCGPGSIEQAHKPDEFLPLSDLGQCDLLLSRLIRQMC